MMSAVTRTVQAGSTAVTLRLIRTMVRLGPVLVLAVLMALMATLTPYFLTGRNLLNVGVAAAPIALLAMGQFLAILTRGIDLSIGSLSALVGVCGALVYGGHRSGALVVMVMLAVGVGVGLLNGVLFVGFRIPHSFIVTLGTYNVTLGAAYLLAHGEAVPGVPPVLAALGGGAFLGVPYPILLALVVLVAMAVSLRGSQLGRWFYAYGGNPEAARRVGIPVGSVLVLVYVFSGLGAAFAGMVLAGRTASGDPNAGTLSQLQSIAAVIIGGASFFGGRGRVSSVVVGSLILAVIANGLNLLNVNAFWQLVATGIVLVLAVVSDIARSRIESRLRLAAGAEQ